MSHCTLLTSMGIIFRQIKKTGWHIRSGVNGKGVTSAESQGRGAEEVSMVTIRLKLTISG